MRLWTTAQVLSTKNEIAGFLSISARRWAAGHREPAGICRRTCRCSSVERHYPKPADNVLRRSGTTAMNPITPITKANATPD